MSPIRTTAYRYPGEQGILLLTLLGVFIVIAVTSTVTVCSGFLVIVLVVGMTYLSNRSHHQALVRSARPVDSHHLPELAALAGECIRRLQPGPVEVFVAPNPNLNAYTFGLADPRVVVLYSGLLREMDVEELRFIIGHELGHVSLGHTWLNSVVGGMAGIPATLLTSVVLNTAFLWWNRACEYSADRAGLLACGKLDKALSALIKLQAGPGGVRRPEDLQRALRSLQQEDDTLAGNLAEVFATHPLMLRRIQALREYAATSDYRRLQTQMDRSPI